jgi:hypothetical protein
LAKDAALLPTRVRRLSNIEYERTLEALLGTELVVAERLPPDIRQAGYTRNADQNMPAHSAQLLAALSEQLASSVVKTRLDSLAPCHRQGVACEEQTILKLASQAWRRTPRADELVALRRVFEHGKKQPSDFASGLKWLLTALMQSPSLLYISERGRPDTKTGRMRLDGYEVASSLAYLLSGGPPDHKLIEAAATGKLASPEEREAQARRVLGKESTRHHFRQFVLEWLEVDELAKTAKDQQLFPSYDTQKQVMLGETRAFVDEVMVHRGASVRALLNAGFVSVEPQMARFYGLKSFGPQVHSLRQKRAGVLQHASFLAAHSHPDSTSPVKRGDFVLRQVLCEVLPRPTELDIEVTIPPVDATQTARQRFSRHTRDKKCNFCHESIDALGFTFEEFDAVGALRELDHGKRVDTQVSFRLGPLSRPFRDSLELSEYLANSPQTTECFARQAFRFFSAQADPQVEASFLALIEQLPEERRTSLVEILVQYVKSDLFAVRRPARSAR